MNAPREEEVKKLKDTFLNPDLLDPEFDIQGYVDKGYECGQDLIDLFNAYHSRSAVGEIDWASGYKKEVEDMRELVAHMADAILMHDAYEGHECTFDSELWEKGIELAEIFNSDALAEHKRNLESLKSSAPPKGES